jgi:hypothetical protein
MAINPGDGFIAVFLFEGLVCARSGRCNIEFQFSKVYLSI